MISINDRPVRHACRRWIRARVDELSILPPRIAHCLRSRRELKRNTQCSCESFSNPIACSYVDQVNVVDDLAAFLFTIDLLFVPDKMLVGILPAMAYCDRPGILLQFNSFGTQTGRRYSCCYSALRQRFGSRCDQAQRQNRSSRNEFGYPHSLLWLVSLVFGLHRRTTILSRDHNEPGSEPEC